jgi:hypothetical protein
MILTGETEAAGRRVCLLDLQLLGTGMGILCDAPAGAAVIDTACAAFEPITYSLKDDSPKTRDQVREHNAAWDALCKAG